MSEEKKNLYILDGYNIIYRSYFAHSVSPLFTSRGENIGAYYGFFQTLIHLFNSNKIDLIAVAMDEEGKTFRHEMYSEYKANRDRAPLDLHSQVPFVKETLRKVGIPVLSKRGVEADDIIASLSKKGVEAGYNVVIVTSDKDLMQLVNDNTFVLRPPKGNEKEYVLMDKTKVEEFYGVKPEQIVDYLTILGDSSDNVPGIKGLGEKAASRLLTLYMTLDGVYRHLDSLKESEKKKLLDGKKDAELSKTLITLSFDALPSSFDFSSLESENVSLSNAREDFVYYGQRRLIDMLDKFNNNELPQRKEEEISSRLENNERYLLKDGEGENIENIENVISLIRNSYKKDIVIFPLLTYGKYGLKSIGLSFSLEMFISFSFLSEDVNVLRQIMDEIKKKNLSVISYDASTYYRFLKIISFDYPLGRNLSLEAWEIDSNENDYSLSHVYRLYFGLSLPSPSSILNDKNATIDDFDKEALSSYSILIANDIRKLSLVLERRFINKEEREEYEKIEKPLSPILIEMEDRGIYLDRSSLLEMSKDFIEKIEKLKNEIFLLSGTEFNINSPQQLGKILFENLQLPHGKKTQSGYSTDTETLEGLRSESPIIDKILSYRGIMKLKNTYVDVLPTLQDKNGRIHTTFLQTGTATGRLSSKEPNLQNIPVRSEEGRKIRSAFHAKSGHVFLSADYSQIELVVLSNLSKDERLSSAFLSGEDVHRSTASLIFEKSIDEVTKEERQSAKVINFGIIYGMSPFRLSRDLGIKREEAYSFINKYFEKYSGVKEFIEKCNKEARENGYVRTYFGHRRNIPGLDSVNKSVRAAAERTVLNSIIQGTAAEVMKTSMIKVDLALKKERLESALLLTVHDELILECPIMEVERVKEIVKREMEGAVDFSVPLRVSIETSSSWGDIH